MTTKTRDQLLLLAVGLACAAFAALFFRFAGSDAWVVLLGLSLFAMTADNARLRREIKRLRAERDDSR